MFSPDVKNVFISIHASPESLSISSGTILLSTSPLTLSFKVEVKAYSNSYIALSSITSYKAILGKGRPKTHPAFRAKFKTFKDTKMAGPHFFTHPYGLLNSQPSPIGTHLITLNVTGHTNTTIRRSLSKNFMRSFSQS